MVRNQGASTTRRTTQTSSSSASAVWETFTKNRPAAGGALTATCKDCGQTLHARSSIGTSHLHRHVKTKRCKELADSRRRQQLTTTTAPSFTAEAASPPPAPGDQDDHSTTTPAAQPVYVEQEKFFVVDGVDIPELLEHLVDKDLADIDEEPSRADELDCPMFARSCADVPLVPQAASSSTRWFLQKKKDRKLAESNKGKDESAMDPLSAQEEFSSRSEKRKLLLNSAAATATIIQDHSHQPRNKSRSMLPTNSLG